MNQTVNPTIIITGGASGIGFAAAKTFAQKGFNVSLLDLNTDALIKAKDELTETSELIQILPCDITNETQVSDAMDACIERFGQINAVLPSAGIIQDGYFIKTDQQTGKVKKAMSMTQFNSVINVNLTGTFNTLQQAAVRMVNNDWKGVLYVVSSINQGGQLGQLNYVSTKHALALWPKLLVGEFIQQGINGIRVVGISPGYVDTPILQAIKPEIQSSIIKDIGIGRFLKTDEITATLWHIWENKAINATTIEVSGGVVQRGMCK